MIYQFGDCTFDTAREEVRRAGEVINTEPQALKVLRYLLEHRDRVVSRDELFEQCWPDSYVSDATLTSCLRRVRQAIGQTRTGPTLIETMHRRGYRFVAEVVEVGETEAPAAQGTPLSEPPALAPESSETAGPLILVVEDEPNSRELLERQLHRCGYATRSAGDGQEALDQVAAEAPDLILLDVRMPVLDGFAVCRQLKTDEATRSIPIILLTALDQPEDRSIGLEAGADAFLTKPVQRQELMARIETILRPTHTADGQSLEIQSDLVDSSSPPASPSEPAAVTERRHLTVLSCTLAEAETLFLHLDPEDHYDLLQNFRSLCLEIVAQYEGHVAQQFDDGVLVYFGYPQAHEDDAQRAVRSGLALVEAMQGGVIAALELPGTRLEVRVGIATGLMIVTLGGASDSPPLLGVGSASTLAVRLAALAPPGTVMISEATAQLVASYFECKALDEAVLASAPESGLVYEVRGESALQTRLEVESAYGLTPFVGREAEVALFQERWTYVQEGMGQVMLVQGEAGMGKSRLVQVLKEQVVDEVPLALEHRCSPYHQNTALYPIIDLIQRALQRQSVTSPADRLKMLETLLTQYDVALEETVPLLADLLSLPLLEGRYAPLNLTPQRQRERTLEMLLSFILVQASKSPLLFVVEDVHWADPSTLEFLQLLTEHVATASMLVVLTCRSGFETPWGQRAEITPVVLNRLTRVQTEQMITQVAGGKQLSSAVLEQLVDKTDGVPLFVEELTRMVLESGQLVDRDAHYELSGELAELTIPATLHDSLMARLDRLGTGKDIAQWGSVLGREFSYEVLEAVTPYDEGGLRTGLAQLVQAELVFQRGLLPQARYRFKHALIQDAAYDSLLKRQRQGMHQQIAAMLCAHFPEMVETEPELVAQHYTAADSYEQAIPYWYRAGQIALQASANQEAIERLKKGLELLAKRPETPERARQELDFQTTIGPALMVTRGFGHPEVEHAYTRARELCEQVGETSELFPVLWGLLRYYRVRGDLHTARKLGDDLLTLAQRHNDPILLLASHAALGSILYFLGEFAAAHVHLEQGLTYQYAQIDRSYDFLHGEDPGVQCLHFLSWALWYLGYPDQALRRNDEALTLAQELAHPASQVATLYGAVRLRRLRRELHETYELAESTIAFSTEQGIAYQLALGTFMRGWVLFHQGQGGEGIAQMSQSLTAIREAGGEVARPSFLALLADAYGKAEQAEKGLSLMAEVQAIMDRNGQRFYDAEVHMLRGELFLHQAIPDAPQAEVCFTQALDIARQQQSKAWELRVATRLARLWQQQGKRSEARELLAPVYGWFTEGFDTADLRDAKTLLEELSP